LLDTHVLFSILVVLLSYLSSLFFFFFFNDPTPTYIYTLSLHDALPIYSCTFQAAFIENYNPFRTNTAIHVELASENISILNSSRSEEHTSELQSQSNLVCRLLLEKKKKK